MAEYVAFRRLSLQDGALELEPEPELGFSEPS